MIKQTKLVPKRRFKEFHNTHPWERRKLGEESVIVAGGDINKEKISDVGMYPVFANALTNEGIVGYYKNDYRIEAPAVTVTGRGDVGHAQARKVNFTPVVRLLAIKSEHDVDYLENAINNQKVVVESTGVPQLTSPQLQNYKIYFPSLDEEKKIGKFFNELNAIIAHHQRKSEKFKALKAAYLSEMFPAEGEVVPKRRFTKFDDDWNQCKVSEFGNQISSGGTPKTNYENYWNGNIPWIQSSDLTEDIVAIKESRKKITEEAVNNSATKIIPKNSIAVVTRVGVGKLALIPFEYATSQDFLSISNLNLDKWFATYALYNVLQKEKKSVQGTSIKGMTKDDLLTKEIMIPASHEEQQQIGAYLLKLDNLIALHQNKLNKLQNLKKAYLTEMFI